MAMSSSFHQQDLLLHSDCNCVVLIMLEGLIILLLLLLLLLLQ
jgi:hypothetical protein